MEQLVKVVRRYMRCGGCKRNRAHRMYFWTNQIVVVCQGCGNGAGT
jgi:hypothetical protein